MDEVFFQGLELEILGIGGGLVIQLEALEGLFCVSKCGLPSCAVLVFIIGDGCHQLLSEAAKKFDKGLRWLRIREGISADVYPLDLGIESTPLQPQNRKMNADPAPI
jgi:hypothetical protein